MVKGRSRSLLKEGIIFAAVLGGITLLLLFSLLILEINSLNPTDIFVDEQQNIYLISGDTIVKFNSSGKRIKRIERKGLTITDLYVDEKGFLYTGLIYAEVSGEKLDMDGKVIFQLPHLGEVSGVREDRHNIDVDKRGNIYIEAGQRIGKFNSQGEKIFDVECPEKFNWHAPFRVDSSGNVFYLKIGKEEKPVEIGGKTSLELPAYLVTLDPVGKEISRINLTRMRTLRTGGSCFALDAVGRVYVVEVDEDNSWQRNIVRIDPGSSRVERLVTFDRSMGSFLTVDDSGQFIFFKKYDEGIMRLNASTGQTVIFPFKSPEKVIIDSGKNLYIYGQGRLVKFDQWGKVVLSFTPAPWVRARHFLMGLGQIGLPSLILFISLAITTAILFSLRWRKFRMMKGGDYRSTDL